MGCRNSEAREATCRWLTGMRAAAGSEATFHFTRARNEIVVWGTLGTLMLLAFAAWLTYLVLEQPRMPTAAGHVIAPMFIAGIVALR